MIHRSYYVKTGSISCKFANLGLGITFFFPFDSWKEKYPPPFCPNASKFVTTSQQVFAQLFKSFEVQRLLLYFASFLPCLPTLLSPFRAVIKHRDRFDFVPLFLSLGVVFYSTIFFTNFCHGRLRRYPFVGLSRSSCHCGPTGRLSPTGRICPGAGHLCSPHDFGR